MIAPRVQPIDNEPGRCSSWIARHASFYDDDQPALPSCRFARAQLQIQQPLPVNYRSLNPCVERSYDDDPTRLRGDHPTFESLPMDVETLPYQASLPCAVSSASIEQLQSQLQPQCSQLRDCAQNLAHGGAKSCQLTGPVDVEDLALYFEPDKPPSINCPPRVYRPSSSDSSNFRRAKSTRYGPYPSLTNSDKRLERSGFSSSEIPLPRVNWLDEREFCNDCPRSFALCNEERWLQCPASDRCPLYDGDTAFPYGQNVLPPCLLEDLRNEGRFRYEDEQLLEDYLSNEKRKEKSRDAARCRRSKETDIFTELAAALPLPPEQAAHLDKASVMRLAIAYLKVRSVVDSIPGTVAKSETLNQMDELFAKALNGFMLVLSSDGNMIYLSENVSDYLGVSQMDMMGQSVYEYSHPCDHEELRECLSSKPPENNDKRTCSFFLRLKCTLTNKGRKVNLKSASYKVIHCTGRLTYIRDPASSRSDETNENGEQKSDDEEDERDSGASLVLLGCPIPHPSNIEIPLGRHTFLSKHSLSMKFTYADEKLAEYLGWDSEELVGQSVFEFHHALDNLALDKSFKSLFSKGQCETVAYRFLGKRGGYAWVVTQATLIHCTKQQKPLSVVCVNYILR
ncbi:hypothetical protein K0M31_014549 [Melipona bicolor]|uniref:Hypoxia-inducible factor 1-alpha n=1 Tax=Melipona bicolor TaxID=60889 RepID=A0AA40G915_9HYME|nr:hypothetical protein K0M31_014549 [Melipona bicolor]